MLCPEDGGSVLYNAEEDMLYKTERDFSGTRILANCGKWFLMLDSKSNLYIVDVFSNEKRFDLPPLESILSDTYSLKRVGDMEFRCELKNGVVFKALACELRERLWVDEKAGELSLVWFFDAPAGYLGFYKKGNAHYSIIPVWNEVIPKLIIGLRDLVLRGYRLYILTTRMVRVIDFSAQQGFQELSRSNISPLFSELSCSRKIRFMVTTAGEVLLVWSTIFSDHRRFYVYKSNPDAEPDDVLEVDSLGDEAMLLDLAITLPANQTLGIKPNTIYFTRHHDCITISYEFFGFPCDRTPDRIPYEVDICVFDMETKAFKTFPTLANMNLKDARWMLPMA